MSETREAAEAIRKKCAEMFGTTIPDWKFDFLMRYHDAREVIGEDRDLDEYLLSRVLAWVPEAEFRLIVEELEGYAKQKGATRSTA